MSPEATGPGAADALRVPAGAEQRAAARELAGALLAEYPRLRRIGSVDLASTAEQLLFATLREQAGHADRSFTTRDEATDTARSLGRVARAVLRRPGAGKRVPGGVDRPVVVVANAAIHLRLVEPVAVEIARRGGPSTVAVLADAVRLAPHARPVLRLGAFLERSRLPALARYSVEAAIAARGIEAWVALNETLPGRLPLGALRHTVATGLPRASLIAAQLAGLARRLRPAVLVAYNEVDVWSRLVPVVAHGAGVRAVDLPHAESADPWASTGLEYDAVAVYGPRAVETMRLTGLAPDRIVAVGSVRYDALLDDGALARPQPPDMRRLVFASQWTRERGSAVTPAAVALAFEAALAAAAAVAPATLVLRPHPVEDPAALQELLAGRALPPGVEARLDPTTDLHELLRGAFLLVTPYSQSVFEATIAGVPAMTVHGGPGPDPVTFAEEGIAAGVRDPSEAAAVAGGLRAAPQTWVEQVERARAALRGRIGEVDGHAAERTADLVLRLAAGDPGG